MPYRLVGIPDLWDKKAYAKIEKQFWDICTPEQAMNSYLYWQGQFKYTRELKLEEKG